MGRQRRGRSHQYHQQERQGNAGTLGIQQCRESRFKIQGRLRFGGELATNLYYRVYAKRFDQDAFTTSSGQSSGDAWNSTQAGFRMDWEPPSQNVLTLQGDYYYSVAGKPSEQVTLAPPAVSLITENEYNQGGNILGRWTRNFSDTSQLTLQTYFDHVEQEDGFGMENLNTWDIDLQDRFALGSWNDFLWGTGYRYQSDENSSSYELTWTPETEYIRLFNVFGQDDFTLVPDRLHLMARHKIRR